MNESMNFVGCDQPYPEEKALKRKKAVGVLVYRRCTACLNVVQKESF